MKDLFFIFVLWAWIVCVPASVLADSRTTPNAFVNKMPPNGHMSTSTADGLVKKPIRSKASSLSGVIKSITEDGFVISVKNKGNYAVVTNDSVSYLNNSKASNRSVLAVGRTAVVSGALSGDDKIITATKANIKVVMLKMAANMTVSTVDNDNATIVVSSKKGKTYTVTTDKAVIQNQNKENVALNAVTAGDAIYLVGSYESNSSTVKATKIKLLNK